MDWIVNAENIYGLGWTGRFCNWTGLDGLSKLQMDLISKRVEAADGTATPKKTLVHRQVNS